MPPGTLHTSSPDRTDLLLVAAHSGSGEGHTVDAELGRHDFMEP